MKNLVYKMFLFLTPFIGIYSDEEAKLPEDQMEVIFGSGGYVLYKALDFANDHGFRYFKILSYEFNGFDHSVTGSCKSSDQSKGRYFELKDEVVSVSIVCYEEKPNDPQVIDLEKYREFLDEVQDEEEEE